MCGMNPSFFKVVEEQLANQAAAKAAGAPISVNYGSKPPVQAPAVTTASVATPVAPREPFHP